VAQPCRPFRPTIASSTYEQTIVCLHLLSKTHTRFTFVSLTMQSQYRDDPSNHLPEVHHQEQSYTYSIPEQSPLYTVVSTKAYDRTPSVEAEDLPETRKGWKRWWILALIGLFIALIAGLVGGMIGQEVQKGREPLSAPAAASASPSSATANTTCPASKPPPNAIPVSTTGCNFPDNKDRRRLSNSTVYSNYKYTTVCNSGWGGAALIGIRTLTPSDCMESCLMYNGYAQGRPKGERSCVGGGFIPAFVDSVQARKEMPGGPPNNCFLMSDATGIRENERAPGTEVVALCLDGHCNDAGTK
jgi:hypothetical protein